MVKYAKYNTTYRAWNSMTFDTSGYFTSLALDQSGRPKISYYNPYKRAVKCWSMLSVGSSIETLDTTSTLAWQTSIKIDRYNRPQISYYDNRNGILKYAIKR